MTKKIEKLKAEYHRLAQQKEDMMDESAKKGEPWDVFVKNATQIALKMNAIRQEISLMKEPVLRYKKDDEITFKRYTLEEFTEMCRSGELTDNDGVGEYASEKAISDIEIYPSDILENKVRKDFTHIAWYAK